jgi:hypothetical protein
MATLARHAKAQKYVPRAILIEKSAPNAGKYFKLKIGSTGEA